MKDSKFFLKKRNLFASAKSYQRKLAIQQFASAFAPIRIYVNVNCKDCFCTKCNKWIHHKCSNITGSFKKDPNFVCECCVNQLLQSPIAAQKHLQLSDIQLEQVAKFCYIGDMIGQSCGDMDVVNFRVRYTLKKFHELLPNLSNHCISFEGHSYVYNPLCAQCNAIYQQDMALTTEVLTRLC